MSVSRAFFVKFWKQRIQMTEIKTSLACLQLPSRPQATRRLFIRAKAIQNHSQFPGEFIDYVFSDASSAAKTVLADGFGLDAFLGFAGQEEVREYDSDDDDRSEMKGLPEDRIGTG